MADAAVATLLKSAAPGQFDAVVESLAKLGVKSSSTLDQLKSEQQAFQCIGVNDQAVSHPLAGPLKEKLKKYQESTFGGNKVSARIAMTTGDSASQLIVHTYAEKLDLPNQYTGYWKSTWTITATSGDAAEVKGDVQLRTYSYEEGNIQLQTGKTFEATIVEEVENEEAEEPPSLAFGVLQQIVAWEHEVMGLLASLHDLSNENLRQIRRVLPITRTKMKWEIAAQRSVNHLKKTTPAKR